ncbi:MAG: long-chain fatty acid--CoA ligase [Bacteroidales bacterium]|nr:long-chain fatty acid--CoA ligase [Bacteroidales bacterium]
MDKPTRLFDLLPYRKATKPDRAVWVAKQQGQWKRIFIDEYIEMVDAISYALLHKGIVKGDSVALISSDRPEWNCVDLGTQQTGAVLVPIYPTISEEDYRYILNDCKVRYLVVENEALLRKVQHLLPELTTLKEVCLIDRKEPSVGYATLADWMEEGRREVDKARLDELKNSVVPRDVATMIYTSGTTGFPKGVMLCHENVLTCLYGVQGTPKAHFSRAMSFLPLCHVYERMMNYLYQYMGYETWYAESIAKVAENMKDARPHMMTAVPRFIEKMYDGIYRKGETLKGMKRRVFFWSLRLAVRYDLDGTTWWYRLRRQVADRLVYRQIRDTFGGCLEMFVSGGSAIQPRLARFFTCVGMDIYEGYGLTETAPVIAVSSSAPHGRKLGTVGLPLPGVEVRVLEGTNEIVCRGPNVMLGYYGQPELTKEAIDEEGWFHTGDTGAFEPEGQLRITGRTKTMFKTSMGKWVNPEVLEDRFKESPFILDMVVVGDNQKFAAALIVPDFQFLKDWQERHRITCDTRDEMVNDKKTLERYARVIEKYNKGLGSAEQIRRFKVINDEWTIANGCLTPTMKVKRAVIKQRCKGYIDELFK